MPKTKKALGKMAADCPLKSLAKTRGGENPCLRATWAAGSQSLAAMLVELSSENVCHRRCIFRSVAALSSQPSSQDVF